MSLQMFKLDLEKGRTRDQIANICWIIEKSTEFQEKIYFCFTDYEKAFDCVDYNRLENSMDRVAGGLKSRELQTEPTEQLSTWHILSYYM